MAPTRLSEQQLVRLREIGYWKQIGERFVDPYVINQCDRVLERRGEVWAASVLGRDLSRRSMLVRNRPYLTGGEPYTLVLASRAEDGADFAAVIAGH